MANLVVFVLLHLVEITLFALAAETCGRLASSRLSFRDGFERSAVSCALGLGILSCCFNLLGLAGALTRPAVLALVAAPLLLRAARPRIFRRLPRPDFPRGAGIAILALPLAAGLAWALYPPTAFDSTLYHLPIAKAFAARHAIVFLPDLRFPVGPQLFELLYAGSLIVADDVTAQLVHFLALVVSAAALVAWGRRFATERAGVWAAAAWLGNALVLSVGGAAMVDVGLALFCTMALLSWEVWRERGDVRWLTASAAFAGFAASTKYLGLFFVAALPAATLLSRAASRRRLRNAAGFAAVALLVLAPFYWRIVSETGNPVFPYFSRWFGENAWSESLDPLGSASASGQPAGSVSATRMRDLTDPRKILEIAASLVLPGGISGADTLLSPFVLLIPPLLLWRARRDRRVRPLIWLGVAYGLCWFLAFPDKRFLFPMLPAWTAGAAAGLDDLAERVAAQWARARSRLASVLLVFLLVAPGAAFTARVVRRHGPLPATPAERDAYLTRMLTVYPALRSLNERFGRDYVVYVLFRENAAYFADGRFLGDHFGPNRFAVVIPFLGDPPRLRELLKSMGATHLLIDRTERKNFPIPIAAYAAAFRALPSPGPTALFEVP